jgi:hypothetical protein
MENPEGRYWTTVVGNNPLSADEEFVGHRSSFIGELVEFNELKEACTLRRQFMENSMRGEHTRGLPIKVDLLPEFEAIGTCLAKLHRELGLSE